MRKIFFLCLGNRSDALNVIFFQLGKNIQCRKKDLFSTKLISSCPRVQKGGDCRGQRRNDLHKMKNLVITSSGIYDLLCKLQMELKR